MMSHPTNPSAKPAKHTQCTNRLPLVAFYTLLMMMTSTTTTTCFSFQIQSTTTSTATTTSRRMRMRRMMIPNDNNHNYNHNKCNNVNILKHSNAPPSSLLFMAMSSSDDHTNNNSNNSNNNNDNPSSPTPPTQTFLSFHDEIKNENGSSSSSTIIKDTSTSTVASTVASTTTNNEPPLSSMEQALMEARQLKERAEKERLEAEKMRIELTLCKIDALERKLVKITSLENNDVLVEDKGEDGTGAGAGAGAGGSPEVDMKLVQESEDLKQQIEKLKNQLDVDPSMTKTKATPSAIPVTQDDAPATTKEEINLENLNIPPMPKDVFQKRTDAFKKFPKEVKEIYVKAVNADEKDDIDTIVQKLYILEQMNKQKKEELSDDTTDKEEEGDSEITLLDIANAQAGYYTLPANIQEMICEQVGMTNERNATVVVERLLELNKIRPTGDFGGVEFAMGDPDEEEEEKQQNRGKDREFTEAELKSAIDLFDNLPLPMRTMLTSSLEADGSNSTAIIEEMIAQKKILPSRDGVEFVVFGNENDELIADSMEMLESDNYVRSMLPAVTRKDGNTPSQAVADAFFSEILGKKTFNPISKPEPIPGGYIIRGENTLKSNDALIIAMEEALAKSSIAGKVQPYLIRDPTSITDEQFETNSFELPVVLITGSNLSPQTNRLVKPLVTTLGGLCVASFSLAVCFGNEDAIKDPEWLEQMSSPLIISILATQIAHEAAHQIVAFKDKFKTGAPTIVPSFQVGLTGCITPLITPPPNFNSLFDFAIAGPLTGMLISITLLYLGLEQQVFMDAVGQSQLPSLPIGLLRSSSLAGGMVEWLLGDGILLSPDPGALITLHPLAIAGFVGIVSNALNLLPVGNTDGGRMSLSLFGRSVSRVVRSGTIGLIVFASFFGGETVNLLLFYTIYAQIWQRDSEIPCKNEVENVDNARAIVALATGLLVALSVIPMI